MHERWLQTLEYHKILEQLASHTSFSAGRELALGLRPSSDFAVVQRWQEETSQARRLLENRTDLTLGGSHDLRPLVKRARLEATLLPTELLDVRDTIGRGIVLRRTILGQADQVPLLAQKAERLMASSTVADEISRCLNDRGEVLDRASPTLKRIRADLATVHDRLMDKLNKIITSPDKARYLQELLITERAGRYVIPLKADFKGRIPGLVHDQSASGATLFIEPMATVELNNQLRELQLKEEKEVERILADLSRLVAQEGEEIEATVQALAELDLALAKARYAGTIRGVEPELIEGTRRIQRNSRGDRPESPQVPPSSFNSLNLINARHPLLPTDTVVPISVHLGGDFFILVITGPNTGGKTVSLKTVGLLAVMAQAGLHIPADEGSYLPVFSGICADIGDEQSIEQSLSTFSSHLTNIVDILKKANQHSLILLDELGAGTDPVEGSALARAILSHLLRRGIMTLVATHFSELKLFAHATPGVQNASVEFDLETLSPTYHLSIGLPGRSNALAIASRLGLSPEITADAESWLSPDELQTESLLAEIKRVRDETVVANEAAQRARREVEGLERELRRRSAEIEEARREVLNQARRQAETELEEMRQELKRIRDQLRQATRETELAREQERLAELEEEIQPPVPPPRGKRLGVGPPQVGDVVWVEALQRQGELLALENDEAEVRVGNLRVRMEAAELVKIEDSAVQQPSVESRVKHPALAKFRPSPGLELNLRGLHVDEAIPRLHKYLDDAYLAGLPTVRIIHGKGTGALRQVVRQELEEHPLVSAYRPGDQNEGGDGVTVVELI